MDADDALIALGSTLLSAGYRFTTITPESHARVNRRSGNEVGRNIRDVFGWSRPFSRDVLPGVLLDLLQKANAVVEEGQLLRSTVRCSTATIGGREGRTALFVHSAFPTLDPQSVFFGPDTYRYLSLLRRLEPSGRRAVDVGCGSGAGGIAIADRCEDVLLADINDLALRYSRVNAAINGARSSRTLQSDVLQSVTGPVDLVISNPPYLIDERSRIYRDGGGNFGEGLSIRIVRESMERLAPGGRLILYTASAIVDGEDPFLAAIEPLVRGAAAFHYEELDPDVFGEELERPAYATAERLAVVAVDVTKR